MKKIIAFMMSPLSLLAADYSSITREKYPDADVVCVEEIESVSYNADGTSETESEGWTKILTEKGRREESTITLNYSKRYGEAAITYVGAIGTNGVERVIDVSGTMSETTDNSSMSENIYDPLDRRIVCTVPGLAIGEVVHVKTRRKTLKSRVRDQWSDICVMEWTHPILKSTYKVKAPASRPIRASAVRHPLGNVSTSVERLADGSMLHTYVATNSARMFPEPDMPPTWTQVQHVRISTVGSWQELSKWYWELCLPHLERTNAEMTNKVAEIGRDMRAIFKFVSQEIRYMGLTLEDTSPGYAPHDVDITFNNRYGVCRDKAALLVAMLRMAGFKAYPVLINVGAKMDAQVPQPFFNHAVVAVEEKDGSCTLMDPTNENTKDLFPSYLSGKSYLVCRPQGDTLRTSPVPKPSENGVDIESSGRLSKDGVLVLENKILFKGINDTAYRGALVRRTKEERIKTFERILKGVATGAELVRCEIKPDDMRDTGKPLTVKLVSRIPGAVIEGVTRDELVVPMVSKMLGVANWILEGGTSLVRRRYPLVLDTTAEVRESVKIDVADALGRPLSLPEALRIDGGYEYRGTYGFSNGVLRVGRRLSLAAVEFSPAEYADLREELKEVEAAGRRRAVFAKNRLSDADVRYLLSSSETTVLSEREWVTTNVTVKEVLTYAGKKESSELKFSYNPQWKEVEILSAVVSNADGRVSAVTPKEMNVMDAAWTGAAPRYPASRILVVNLPSVEIGSVISVTSVVKARNAPESFYASYLFDTHEPLCRKIVRVNDWRRELVDPPRLAREPNQPAASFWRDLVIISSNDWKRTAARFAAADFEADIDRDAAGDVLEEVAKKDTAAEKVRAVRDWMARHVKIAGPSLYELPLESQLTDPATVLKERYATRLDYIRTMCALLRLAGFDADVVLARMNGDAPERLRRRDIEEKPNVRAFSSALCRVRFSEGGFLWFGGRATTWFIGTENQYAEPGASAYARADYFDPIEGTFGVVEVPEPELESYEREHADIAVHEDGAADITIENEICGAGVGAFRKTYSEILPEDRYRRYQEILGAVAQAASATSELECDVESYPAKRRFSCHVPEYATVADDVITLQLPTFANSLPSMTGVVRRTPFAVGAQSPSVDSVTVRFPKGYTEIEHLPEEFTFADPENPTQVWLFNRIAAEVKDGRLEVRIEREIPRRSSDSCAAGFFALVRDWRRISDSRSNRTISVRKSGER
jgi:transglutaminase-like putative cysteine protease